MNHSVASIDRPTLSGQKAPDDAQEPREPVVVEPMPGPVDSDHPGVTEVRRPTVLDGIARAALLAVEEQGRTRDPRPEQLDVAAAHVVGWPRAHVIVGLPAVRPVLVRVRAAHGTLTRMWGGGGRALLLEHVNSAV